MQVMIQFSLSQAVDSPSTSSGSHFAQNTYNLKSFPCHVAQVRYCAPLEKRGRKKQSSCTYTCVPIVRILSLAVAFLCTVPGLLNPLDSPHHMRVDEDSEYREGVVLDRPSKPGRGSFVNCGMKKEVQIDKQLKPGLRVTVRLQEPQNPETKVRKGTVVSSHHPRTVSGLYWGYSVRLASCLSAVFSECPFKEGYDVSIGTSERGNSVDQVTLPSFRHMLVVFGGLQGLEAGVDADPNLEVTDPSVLFDFYLNTCPSQGSRTIRTEEALLISLSALRPHIDEAVKTPTDS